MVHVSSEVFIKVFRILSVDELFHITFGVQEMLEVRHQMHLFDGRFPWRT